MHDDDVDGHASDDVCMYANGDNDDDVCMLMMEDLTYRQVGDHQSYSSLLV